MPVRAQETAPASVEEMTGSEDLRRMVRVLQHVADTTGTSETDAAAGPVRMVRTTAGAGRDHDRRSFDCDNGREQDGTAVKAVPARCVLRAGEWCP